MLLKTRGISIRIATVDDYDAICRLTGQVDRLHAELLPDVFRSFKGRVRPRQRIAHFVGRSGADILVAVMGAAVVGYLSIEKGARPRYPMFKPHEHAQIEDLVVDADVRRQGVGGLLLEAAKQWARDCRHGFVQANVWSANRSAGGFYAKHGFRTVTERLELDLGKKEA